MQSKSKLRPGLIVAIFRIVLVIVLSATWEHPAGRDVLFGLSGLAFLVGYLGFGLAMLAVAWGHWWLDHRLRVAGFLLDAAASFLLLYWVEGGGGESISPFMAIFAYLVITATLIWRPRRAALAAGIIIGGYVGIGFLMHGMAGLWDNGWYLRRLVFMLAIGGLIIWYGFQRALHKPHRLDWPMDAAIEDQAEAVATFVADHIHCTGFAIAWMPDDEPWTYLGLHGSCGSGTTRVSPGDFPWSTEQANGPMLFDGKRGRSLHLTGDDSIVAMRDLPACPLAHYLSVPMGIVTPIQSQMGRGSILLTGIPGISGDHLHPVRELAAEIGSALDRHEAVSLMRNSELARLRLAVARDLHDGVVQSLAGARFRLEALGQAAATGRNVQGDIASIQQSLAREEGFVSELIAQLRGGEEAGSSRGGAADIARSFAQAADHWGISALFEGDDNIDPLPGLFVFEIQKLVREGVANAVRHGGADRVTLCLSRDNGNVHVTLIDNGSGFDTRQLVDAPRSIRDRVAFLGGSLAIASRPGETRLSITLPVGACR